jgi:LCP family protein required for cell wall assembly
MTKKTQSIDGFILKRRDEASPEDADKHIFLDSMAPAASASKPVRNRHAKSEIQLKKTEAALTENTLSADIETSLRNLETAPNQFPEPEEKSRHRKDKKSSKRQERKLKRDQSEKKPHRIRRIIKWFFIAIGITLLVVVGWLGYKALMTGGKIFQGNPFDMLTSKTRLAEDANGRTNILIFGTSGWSMEEDAWDGALLTDSIMVLSVDQDEHNVYMISLPRDLYVRHTCKKLLGTTAGKLNETYYCAYIDSNKNEEKGAAALRETVGDIVGLDVQYYVHADWAALTQAVNAVGGVDVVVESSDSRGIYDKMTGLKVPNGTVHMDGDQALMFSRARGSHGGYGLPGGNFDREKNQQKVLVALQKKALSAGTLANPAAINSLLDAMGDNLRTNFKTSDVQTILDVVKDVRGDDMISLPLVGREGGLDLVTTGMLGSISIVRPVKGVYDYSDIINYIKQHVSSNPVVREAAIVDVLNGSEQAGLAQEKADELKKAGYNVSKTTNAPSIISEKVKIYQLNNDKIGTANALEKRFGVKVIDGKLDGYNSKADFVIVFGLED